MGTPAEKMRPMSASEIAGIADLRIEPVYVEEWKRTVYVRELADADAVEYFSKFSGKTAKVDMIEMCRICALGLCDENGDRLFDDEGGPQQLRRKKFSAVLTIFNRIMELSGLTKSGIEAEKKG